MDRDSKLIMYKYLHNLLIADTMKELKNHINAKKIRCKKKYSIERDRINKEAIARRRLYDQIDYLTSIGIIYPIIEI